MARQFGRLQTRGVTKDRSADARRKEAQTDDKFIKLSKKDDNTAKANRELLERTKRLAQAKEHHTEIDLTIDKHTRAVYRDKIRGTQINLVEDPLQTYELMNETIKETLPARVERIGQRKEKKQAIFNSLDIRNYDGQTWRAIHNKSPCLNAEELINEKFSIVPIKDPHPMSRRSGALGYKMGMTSIWDKWGHLIPLTVIQLDRCQVIRVKTKESDGVDSVLLGAGQKSLNYLTKSMAGNFLKANVPPKLDLREFIITPENALPVGFMVGVRHFTVGQWVDVKARSKGKGFSGAMKRWGFDGLPASHGCSLTHRSHGSTGQRQDPGRVWKGKKMAGRLGNENITVRKLQVYKIDFEKSLLYLRGSVPGPTYRLIEISDAFYHWKLNIGKLNYPTFVPENANKVYARIMQVEPAVQDPTENWLHENAIISDDEEDTTTVPAGNN